MRKTVYEIKEHKFCRPTCFALVADLHGGDPTDVIKILADEAPDYILMAGDIFERLDGTKDKKYENGIKLMSEAAKIAPTFYSTGNHEDGGVHSWSLKWRIQTKEREYDEATLEEIKKIGVTMLTDSHVLKDGIAFGGLCSGLIMEGRTPNLSFLEEFSKIDAPKVLLCHHPEYYEKYLKDMPIDLIVSGHAHGGQWRFFGRGVYAPGQGLFPKYTYGIHNDRFVVSTGLKTGRIPRFFNPPEVVFVRIV